MDPAEPETTAGVLRWRADTPGCAERIHLNNCGASLMPGRVTAAIVDHLHLEERIGGYEAADLRAASLDQVYGELAPLLGCAARNVAVVANATAAFVQALSAFDLGPADAIVTSRADYTSNQIQYLALRERRGVQVIHAEDLPEGGVDPGSIREILRGRAGRSLVAISWVPTHSGLVQDAEAIGAVCAERSAPYIVDACQAAGQMPVDVARLQCDYLSGTARKFLRGPRGIGFLYASDRALARGDHPLHVDMRGATWVDDRRYELAPGARRFEDWEFPYALVAGLAECARYAREVGVDGAQRRAWALAERARGRLAGLPGARVLDTGRRQCAIVTVAFDGSDASWLVARLRERSINTSATLRWYGLLDLGPRGVSTALRISPHYFNTVDEVDTLVSAIDEVRREAGHA